MDWLIIVVVAAATALAMVIVFRIQQNRLRRRFRLEIQNVGNARSRYQLRAEDSGALQFRFTLDGDDLPQALSRPGGVALQDGLPEGVGTPPPAATADDRRPKGASASQRLNQASGLALLAADVLMTVGSLLPHSVGGPLLRRASQLQMGRIRVAQASRVSSQVGSVGRSARRRDTQSAAGVGHAAGQVQGTAQTVPGQVYAETPYIRPGDTLALELIVKTGFTASPQQRGFRIVSRSVEQEEAPLVVEEAQVRLGGGIWGHRYLPYLAVLAMGALILVLALWLSTAGAPF